MAFNTDTSGDHKLDKTEFHSEENSVKASSEKDEFAKQVYKDFMKGAYN